MLVVVAVVAWSVVGRGRDVRIKPVLEECQFVCL
jgi:hypothetical protein